MRRVVLGL